MTPDKINRALLPDSLFTMRGNNVKWPTIRKAWLTDEAVARIKHYVTTRGRSIIFLDGTYRTNLNQWTERDPFERAIFFEYLVRHPRVNGGIYILSWIGDFHNGCIAHFAYQYPQVRCWEAFPGATKFLEGKTYTVYKNLVKILYEANGTPMDEEVENFIRQDA